LAEIGIPKPSWIFEPIDLVKVIRFSCLTVEPLAKEYQIEVEAPLPAEPVKVSGVEEKLNQLFDNILTNAVKYNRPGGKIYVSLEHDAEFVFTRIADTGIGIPYHSLKEVFERHFQEKTEPLGKTRGLGIGLSLVQEIVKLHRGDIQIESELGKGSTFTIRLPKNPS
jgi:signal transduction histidine kinase